MIDGVVTRSQAAAQAAQTTGQSQQAPSPVNPEVPEWKQETDKLRSEFDSKISGLRTTLLSDLHKLLEIALGKKILTESLSEPSVEGEQQLPGGASQSQPAPRVEAFHRTSGEPIVIEGEQGSEGSEEQNLQSVNMAYKLMCPRFDGADFKGWISKLEQFFEAEAIPNQSKIRLVMLHLEGKALQWHQFLIRGNSDWGKWTWEQYLEKLRERFAPDGFEDPFAELLALKQTDTVEHYYEEFISLVNQLNFVWNWRDTVGRAGIAGGVTREARLHPGFARSNHCVFSRERWNLDHWSADIAHRLEMIRVMLQSYGASDGYPSQHGIINDAQAALDHLSQRTDIDTDKIVVFGRSLGGAVGAALTKNNSDKVAALILENTFTSILDMAGVLFPLLKWFIGGPGTKGPKILNFLVRSPWRTIDVVGQVKQPILFLSGLQDEMVPPSQMQMLYAKAAARNRQCQFVEFPTGMHMDTWLVEGDQYWKTMKQFLEQHLPKKKENEPSQNGHGS